MHDNKDNWMRDAAPRSISTLLMTAEQLTKKGDPLDSSDTEKLHWCWEGIHHIMAAQLAAAQLEAHQAAHAPASTDDLKRMIEALGDKITAMTGGNGNGGTATPAKA